MLWVVLLTQVALPLLLLLWLALFPAAGILALVLQFSSVAAILLAISLTALWTSPPFWVPYIYGLMLLLILGKHLCLGKHSSAQLWGASKPNTTIILLVSMLGLPASYLIYHGVQGRLLPSAEVVDIKPPFGSGYYLVGNGGATETVNLHLKTLDKTVARFQSWRGQSKALDIFRTSPLGLHKDGWLPKAPAKYTTFGTPVLSPCQGKIALRKDGVDDMPVPQMDRNNMAGNYLAIDCGDNVFIILAHFRKGSILVSRNDQVNVGDPLGEMGNSGNSSEPHLHIHAQKGLPELTPLGGEPLWLKINGQFLVRNDRLNIP